MVGTLIGPYRITQQVGQGGIGSVFEATHQQIGRRVAIKILRAEHARDKETIARLFNEARAVNRIEHPGLVQIHDCDQLADGRAYLVMEFLQGDTLTQRMARGGGKLSDIEALRVAHQLASILAATHSVGIIHRDLKPGNIMLVKDPEVPGGERVKLLDFGIAKLAPEGTADPGLTRPGVVFGTPTYMSPEQCKGASEVDARSDVYSLGVILFQLLAGRPPFPGEGVGVVAMHLCEDPPSLAEFAPHVSKTVVSLVGSMLAKKREDRPSMEQVATTLRPRAATELYQSSTNMNVPNLQAAFASMANASSADGSVPVSSPSTLGRITGQQVGPKRRLPIVLGTAFGVLLLAGSGLLTVWLVTAKTPAAVRAVPPVRWSLITDPPGATVISVDDGKVLGHTPWSKEQPSANGEVTIRVSKSSYRSSELSLNRRNNMTLTLHLEHEDSPEDKEAAALKGKPVAAPAPIVRTNRPLRPNKPAGTSSTQSDKPSHAETKVVDD